MEKDNEILDTEKKELQKSLEDSLSTMSDVFKSKKDDSLFDDKGTKEKMTKKNEEEDSEDDDSDDDDEDDNKTSKMKKSLDEAMTAHGETIDAVPVLKSFSDTLAILVSEFADLKKSFKKSTKKNMEIQKSFSDVLNGIGHMTKSISDDVELIGETAQPVKGKLTQSQIMNKSFGGENLESEDFFKSIPTNVVRNELMKSFEAGQISSNSISKWELSGYKMSAIPAHDREIIMSKLKKGGN